MSFNYENIINKKLSVIIIRYSHRSVYQGSEANRKSSLTHSIVCEWFQLLSELDKYKLVGKTHSFALTNILSATQMHIPIPNRQSLVKNHSVNVALAFPGTGFCQFLLSGSSPYATVICFCYTRCFPIMPQKNSAATKI